MTPHIEAQLEDIAPRVLMPGDPYRAKYIAETYLDNPKLVNKLRGELAYTGTFKGVPITIFSSGMGIGSMGIYAYELFNVYNVNTIIRVGTAGSYTDKLDLYDIVVASSAYSTTNFDEEAGIEDIKILNSSFELNNVIQDTANLKRVEIKPIRVHTTEAFYNEYKTFDKLLDLECMAVEMETYALLFYAKKFHKKATALLTISDNLVTKERISSEEREKKLDVMIKLALESIIKIN